MTTIKNRMQVPKICQFCSKNFIAQTTVTKCCSDNCAKRLYKQKQREAKIEKAMLDTKEQILNTTIQHITILDKPKEYLCINDISSLLGVSRWTIQRMVKRGDLSVKQVGRKKLLSRLQLEAFFN